MEPESRGEPAGGRRPLVGRRCQAGAGGADRFVVHGVSSSKRAPPGPPIVHTIDPVGRVPASARDPMALLLVLCGGMGLIGLVGCTDGIISVFRPVPGTGDSGIGGGAGVDAGVDISAPEVGTDAAPIICPTKLVGYATLGTTATTGGGDAGVFTASTLEQLRLYAGMPGPAVVRIKGTIAFDDTVAQVEISSDKTILPDKPGDGLTGNGLIIKRDVRNVIVRNLTIAKPIGQNDAISIQTAANVWIDHCDLSSDLQMPKGYYDGLVDITHAADNVTISWNRFHDHYNTSLVGHSDALPNTEDPGHLTVTYHHNWFLRTPSGSPRARFGRVHVFSNLYEVVDTYAIASTMSATVLVESNVFDQVAVPIATHWEDRVDGNIWDLNNFYVTPTSALMNIITTAPMNWKPPYVYSDSVDSTDSTRVVVKACAGVGKVP